MGLMKKEVKASTKNMGYKSLWTEEERREELNRREYLYPRGKREITALVGSEVGTIPFWVVG